MSGSAVQIKYLQSLPHAFSVHVLWYVSEPMGKPIGYTPARLQRAVNNRRVELYLQSVLPRAERMGTEKQTAAFIISPPYKSDRL